MKTSNYTGDEILQHEKSELSVQPTEETFAGSLKAIVVPQVFQTAPIIQQSMRLVAKVSYHSSFWEEDFVSIFGCFEWGDFGRFKTQFNDPSIIWFQTDSKKKRRKAQSTAHILQIVFPFFLFLFPLHTCHINTTIESSFISMQSRADDLSKKSGPKRHKISNKCFLTAKSRYWFETLTFPVKRFVSVCVNGSQPIYW